jgi:hypothetical protein
MTTESHTLTQQRLKDLLTMDEEGFLVWTKPRQGLKVGKRCGTISNGRRRICVARRFYREADLISLYLNGTLPNKQIEPRKKRCLYSNSTTGYRGVTKVRSGRHGVPYVAQSRKKYICCCKTAEEASERFLQYEAFVAREEASI